MSLTHDAVAAKLIKTWLKNNERLQNWIYENIWGFVYSTVSVFPVFSKFKLLQRELPTRVEIRKETFHHLLLNLDATTAGNCNYYKHYKLYTIKTSVTVESDEISRPKFKLVFQKKSKKKTEKKVKLSAFTTTLKSQRS